MKVIFLDNDGVICLASDWGTRYRKREKWVKANPTGDFKTDASVEFRFDHFDKKAVKVVNKILEETGAEIVVSSDWKKEATLEEIGDYYIEQGLIKRPIGMTKRFKHCDNNEDVNFLVKSEQKRCVEIRQYLNDNPEITHWVAIDDLDLGNDSFAPNSSEWGLTNFVRCTSLNEGIKKIGLKKKIIKFLE